VLMTLLCRTMHLILSHSPEETTNLNICMKSFKVFNVDNSFKISELASQTKHTNVSRSHLLGLQHVACFKASFLFSPHSTDCRNNSG
jgi:hypothetical protein